jgi:hypothetical protein
MPLHSGASAAARGGPVSIGTPGRAASGFLNSKVWLTAAALVVAVGGAAWASDHNKAWVAQDGDHNSASVAQRGEGRNEAGSEADPILQNGDGNSLGVVQDGEGNRLGSGPVNVLGVEFGERGVDQTDNGNSLDVRQDGRRNRIGAVQQEGYASGAGHANVLTIGQGGRDRIGLVTQINNASSGTDADANQADIAQGSRGNRIGAAQQAGSANTLKIVQRGGDGNDIGIVAQGIAEGRLLDSSGGTMTLRQNGGGNRIWLATQVGDTNTMTIRQNGDGNTVWSATQAGGGNTMTLAAHGDGNEVRADQLGQDNSADVRIHADGNGSSNLNRVAVSQVGRSNSVTLDITGDGNGMGRNGNASFNGRADIGLAPGTISQGGLGFGVGVGNTISLTIDDSSHTGKGGDRNLFAFDQEGWFNTIDGRQLGDSNQAAIVQRGAYNSTIFTQVGMSNVIGVKQ